MKRRTDRIKHIYNYVLTKGSYPFITVVLAKTADGKFHRGTALCNEIDFEFLKNDVKEFMKRNKMKTGFKELLAAEMEDRGNAIAVGRLYKTLKKKKHYDPIVILAAHEKILSIKNGKDAFTYKHGRLWKGGYNVELSEIEKKLLENEVVS